MLSRSLPEDLREDLDCQLKRFFDDSVSDLDLSQIEMWLEDEGWNLVLDYCGQRLAMEEEFFSDDKVREVYGLSASAVIDDAKRLRFTRDQLARLRSAAKNGTTQGQLIYFPLYQSAEQQILIAGWSRAELTVVGHQTHWFGIASSIWEIDSMARVKGFTIIEDVESQVANNDLSYWFRD